MSVSLASVVVPVYNQAEHIGSVLQDYLHALERLDFPTEILPVINGPRRDQSLEICRSLERQHPSIRTLCIDAGGWGMAVRHGLSQARTRRERLPATWFSCCSTGQLMTIAS
jgi:glycosyltransferase involved in cell wall biosynthesis